MIEFEELEAGGGDPGERPRRSPAALLGWCAVLVVALGLGYVLLGPAAADPVTGTVPPSGAGTAVTAAPGPTRPHQTVRPGPAEYLVVGDVCPVRTDGRIRLAVSFTMVNPSGETIDVLTVAAGQVGPAVPATSRPVTSRPARSGGTCERPGTDRVGGVLGPGESRLFTLVYRLPVGCPQPSPIGVAYRIDVNGQQLKATMPVLVALTSVDFAACPARHR